MTYSWDWYGIDDVLKQLEEDLNNYEFISKKDIIVQDVECGGFWTWYKGNKYLFNIIEINIFLILLK